MKKTKEVHVSHFLLHSVLIEGATLISGVLLHTSHSAETMHSIPDYMRCSYPINGRSSTVSMRQHPFIILPSCPPTFKESCDPLNSAVPLGWKRTLRTALDSGEGSASNWKDSRSQTLAVRSLLPLARRNSLGWNLMEVTGPLWSLNSASRRPALRSHSWGKWCY